MPISTKFPQEDAKLYVITMLYYTSQWGLCRVEIEHLFFDHGYAVKVAWQPGYRVDSKILDKSSPLQLRYTSHMYRIRSLL